MARGAVRADCGARSSPGFISKLRQLRSNSCRSREPEICVMHADGTEQVRLTNFTGGPTPSNGSVTKRTWSPTGDRIAFHRRVGAQGARGHLEVYTMNADGSNVIRITDTVSPGFSGFPSWGKWSAGPAGA